LATGKFVSARLVRVLIEEEMGGVTHHHATDSKETLERYYKRIPIFVLEIEKLFERKVALERVASDFGSLKSSIVTQRLRPLIKIWQCLES
jgi:hypothetical protein